MLSPLEFQTTIECPRCGKHSIVKQGNTDYHCLNCGFHRDTTRHQLGGEPGGFIVAILVSALIILLL